MSHFELLTRKCLQKFFFWVTNSASLNIELNFSYLLEGLTFIFLLLSYYSNAKLKTKKLHFELPTPNQKLK